MGYFQKTPQESPVFKQFENYEIRICCSQSCLTLYSPMDGLQPASLLCPWDFSRQEYWSRLPFLPLEELPNAGIEPTSPVSLTSAGRFFTTEPLGKPQIKNIFIQMSNHFVAHLKLMLYVNYSSIKIKNTPCLKVSKEWGFSFLCRLLLAAVLGAIFMGGQLLVIQSLT